MLLFSRASLISISIMIPIKFATGHFLAGQYFGSVSKVQCDKELWLSLRYESTHKNQAHHVTLNKTCNDQWPYFVLGLSIASKWI